ncbi:hypothetical protein BDV23DRAFT_150671 [Aspergillus alliaceus]|uniref:Uncharacterized protein n=1 Tax=Petromyces alliaceus TaxID=209559 RepID=A0A5N7CFL7_PETAA|nr:hypothetical protein BDV23DRAFT_150671 [Aspergillus alliaceus]
MNSKLCDKSCRALPTKICVLRLWDSRVCDVIILFLYLLVKNFLYSPHHDSRWALKKNTVECRLWRTYSPEVCSLEARFWGRKT